MPDPGGKKGAPVSLPGRPGWSPLYLAAFLVMLYAAGQYLFLRQQPAAAPLEYGVFLDQLEAGNVAEVAIEGPTACARVTTPAMPRLIFSATGCATCSPPHLNRTTRACAK